ncbi:MAG TPA: hypothetical protein VI168_12705 [Croceibacterium sp.]
MNSGDFILNRRSFVAGSLVALLLAQSTSSGAQANRCPARTGGAEAAGAPIGLIEIGSSGVKPSIVRILAGDEPDISVVNTGDRLKNTEANALDLGNAPIVAAAVRDAIAAIRAEGVPENMIKIVGSSGVAGRPDAKEAVQDAVRRVANVEMTFIPVELETQYTFDGVVNKVRLAHRRSQVTLLDIGSGNTKGCYILSSTGNVDTFRNFSMNLGTKSFARLVSEKIGDDETFAVAAQRVASTELRAQIQRMIVEAGASMAQRNRVYLNGGLPWAVATTQNPYNTDRYVPLTVNDLDRFANLALNDQDRLFDLDTSRIPAGTHRDLITGDLRRLSNRGEGAVFNEQEYQAGGALLQVLSEEMALRNKTLFFTRPGRNAWMLGVAFNDVAQGSLACEALPAA